MKPLIDVISDYRQQFTSRDINWMTTCRCGERCYAISHICEKCAYAELVSRIGEANAEQLKSHTLVVQKALRESNAFTDALLDQYDDDEF